jgi:hypothetical protein
LETSIVSHEEVDYDDTRELKMESDGKALEIGWRVVPNEMKDTILDHADSHKGGEFTRRVKHYFSQEHLYFLNNLVLKRSDGTKTDIREITGEGTAIIFSTDDSETFEDFRLDEIICFSGDPTKIVSIAMLLHEIGHGVVESPSIKSRRLENAGVVLTSENVAELLENERDSWAFAINKMRPFLDSEQREILLRFVHEALQERCDDFRKIMPPAWIAEKLQSFQMFLKGM